MRTRHIYAAAALWQHKRHTKTRPPHPPSNKPGVCIRIHVYGTSCSTEKGLSQAASRLHMLAAGYMRHGHGGAGKSRGPWYFPYKYKLCWLLASDQRALAPKHAPKNSMAWRGIVYTPPMPHLNTKRQKPRAFGTAVSMSFNFLVLVRSPSFPRRARAQRTPETKKNTKKGVPLRTSSWRTLRSLLPKHRPNRAL
jgi:hypothetical protein